MVATAGKILSEEELRAYTKCSQFYYYGGLVHSETPLQVVQTSFERVVADTIRTAHSDPTLRLTKNILHAIKATGAAKTLMEGQVQDLVRNTTLYLHEMFKFFSLDTYIPVTGPLPYILKVGRTPIELKLSGTFKTAQNQTLHAVCFTPFTTAHAAAADPVTHLKLQSLKQLVKPHYKRAQARLHLFGISKRNQLVYSSLSSDESNLSAIKQIEQVIKIMESGYHYPLTPCLFSCPFKETCKPGE